MMTMLYIEIFAVCRAQMSMMLISSCHSWMLHWSCQLVRPLRRSQIQVFSAQLRPSHVHSLVTMHWCK